jgi:hypothetical protein
MSEEPRKRSRFDQTEEEPRRTTSRFDRRSRSPAERTPDSSTRVRSPIGQGRSPAAASDAAAAAAAAAAKINAQLQAKRATQVVDVPPIRSTSTSGGAQSPAGGSSGKGIYQEDGDFIKDIEVNNLHNRYMLTKGSTQKMVNILLCDDIADSPVAIALAILLAESSISVMCGCVNAYFRPQFAKALVCIS